MGKGCAGANHSNKFIKIDNKYMFSKHDRKMQIKNDSELKMTMSYPAKSKISNICRKSVQWPLSTNLQKRPY